MGHLSLCPAFSLGEASLGGKSQPLGNWAWLSGGGPKRVTLIIPPFESFPTKFNNLQPVSKLACSPRIWGWDEWGCVWLGTLIIFIAPCPPPPSVPVPQLSAPPSRSPCFFPGLDPGPLQTPGRRERGPPGTWPATHPSQPVPAG